LLTDLGANRQKLLKSLQAWHDGSWCSMAIDFKALAESIHHTFPGTQIEPATEEQLAGIRHAHPKAPEHYLEFLREVGWGSLGGGNFMIYSGPCDPGEIFDEATAAELAGILLLGDNFGGWLLGFDTLAGWQLVGVDNGSLEPKPVVQHTLAEFIAQRVMDGQDAEPDAPERGR